MPTITASSILSKVETLLQDTTNIRWAEPELLGWLNDGQREVSIQRPDSCTKLTSVALVAGTKQSIPSDGTVAIKVIRNMGSGGSTPGKAIRKVPMELLDSTTPDWHSATQVATVLHYSTDPRMPRTFYVYPPANGTTQVELLYASPPLDIPAFTAASTYSQTTTVITVTSTAHGYAAGSWVQFVPSTGLGTKGYYQIVTVPTVDTFTITAPQSQSTSGAATLNGVINVDDVYSVPLIDYCCYRAYMKDNDLIANKERATAHRQLFDAVLAGKTQVDIAVNQSKDNVAG